MPQFDQFQRILYRDMSYLSANLSWGKIFSDRQIEVSLWGPCEHLGWLYVCYIAVSKSVTLWILIGPNFVAGKKNEQIRGRTAGKERKKN